MLVEQAGAASVPPWLATMRVLQGTAENTVDADNPIIMAWPREIAACFPEMSAYCALFTGDEIAWCGLTVAIAMARNGIRPPFGSIDTTRFLWADAWRGWGVPLSEPVPGAVLVFPHHVTLYLRTEGEHYVCLGGNQSDQVRESRYLASECVAIRWHGTNAFFAAAAAPKKRFLSITATVFGGVGDEQSVKYPDVASGWQNRYGVALPNAFKGKRPQVRVTYSGKSVVCDIVDLGPWNISDPYWETGTRPQAEAGIDRFGRSTNGAGIDLTPAAAAAIGLPGKGLVDWEFVADQIDPVLDPQIDTPIECILETLQVLRELLEVLVPIITNIMERNQMADPIKPVTPAGALAGRGLDPNAIAIVAQIVEILFGLMRRPGSVPTSVLVQPEPASPAPPVIPAPVVPVAPAPVTPSVQNPGVQIGAFGLAISTVLQAFGVVGTPFGIGDAPTQTGTIATLVPALTGLVGMTGGWGAALNIGLKLLGAFAGAAKK